MLSRIAVALTLAALSLLVLAPGGGADTANVLAITYSGGAYTLPDSAPGGPTEIRLTNGDPKLARSAQLVRYEAGHTAAQAYAEVIKESDKSPSWVHALGGLSAVRPKSTASAVVDLPPGDYLVVDAFGDGKGKPAYKAFTVTPGPAGALPAAPPTIRAASVGKDRWAWKLTGALKASTRAATFVTGGTDETYHFLGLFRVKGHPSKAQLIKALKSHGRPPSFIDPRSFFVSSILDGGLREVTPVHLSGKGTYVLFCPLTDKDGGKPHFEEGLLKTVTVR